MFAWIFTIVSFVIQQVSSANIRKKQAEARDAAERKSEASKGTSVVVSGEAAALKVIYGRNLVGGVRLYHNTFNDYVYAPPSGARAAVFSAASLGVTSAVAGSSVSGPTQGEITITTNATWAGYNEMGISVEIPIVLTKTVPAGTLISGVAASVAIEGHRALVTLAPGSEIQSVNKTSVDDTAGPFEGAGVGGEGAGDDGSGPGDGGEGGGGVGA